MSFFPDITPDGKLEEPEPAPQLYTPRELHQPRRESWEIHKDVHGTHVKDAPTMENIHECAPNSDGECLVCGRLMLI